MRPQTTIRPSHPAATQQCRTGAGQSGLEREAQLVHGARTASPVGGAGLHSIGPSDGPGEPQFIYRNTSTAGKDAPFQCKGSLG
ncbi:hypothetical protein ACLOJK_003717 [Asimina triloba]